MDMKAQRAWANTTAERRKEEGKMINAISVKNLLQRKLIVGIILAIAGVSVAVPAYAHYMYEEGYTYSSDHDCARNRAEISHGSGGGYSESKVESSIEFNDIPCSMNFPRPPKYLRVSWKLQVKDGSSWKTCKSSSNYYNGKSDHKLDMGKDYGASPPCGDGVYRTKAYGHLKNNGEWHGGSIVSGVFGHSLP